MNIRWMAVLTGFVVDIALSTVVGFFTSADFSTSPDPTRPGDMLFLALLTLSTGIGGYVAGRMARDDRVINGLLVAIVGILINQLGPPLPKVFVIASAIACGVAALGGFLSRYPASRHERSSRRGS